MLRYSRMLALGTGAPSFDLPDSAGQSHSLAQLPLDKGLLVAFICNHCPFVHHLLDAFVALAAEAQAKGVQVVAISSNDVLSHPEDGPSQMAELAAARGFGFPYLYDESQQVALAYGAICTPDFFVFDPQRRLVYRGQFDASRPRIDRPPLPGAPPLRTDLPVTGADLRAAIDAMLAGRAAPEPQHPSAGCSIKWRPENEPDWA